MAGSTLRLGMPLSDFNNPCGLDVVEITFSHLESGSRTGRNMLALYLLSVRISCFLLHALSKLNLCFTGEPFGY